MGDAELQGELTAPSPTHWPSQDSEVDSAEFVTARLALMETRGMSATTATKVLQERKCEECKCALEAEHDGDCCCPCHCACCCPPLFQCMAHCVCKCGCHYDPHSDGDGDEQDDEMDEPKQEMSQHGGAVGGHAGSTTIIGELVTCTPSQDSSSGTGKGPQGERDGDETNAVAAQPETPDGVETNTASGGMEEDTARKVDGQAEPGCVPATKDAESDVDMDDSTPPLAQNPPDDEDTDMSPVQITAASKPAAIFEALVHLRSDTVSAGTTETERLMGLLFASVYRTAIPGNQAKKKENQLPTLNTEESTAVVRLCEVLLDHRKYSYQRLVGALKDLSVASARSSWSFNKILTDRVLSAQQPVTTPANVWTQKETPSSTTARSGGLDSFQFDAQVFSTECSVRYRAICAQDHVFAETTREPTSDEWAIMVGMMNGTILTRALPQFLKRCCTMTQLAWIHSQMIQRAEGELWAPLPERSKMYDFNQSSKRLIAELRKSAAHQNWTDERLEPMLSAVKVATYNHDMHAIHLHFYTKAEAKTWEGMPVPFRTSRLVLRNPEGMQMLTEPNEEGNLVLRPSDGLKNDRYQAHYKIRLSNVTRTMDMDRLTQYLQTLTDDGMQIGVPLDSYGPNSEWSLLWDFYAKRSVCPEKLVNINRIVWGGHTIMLRHKPDQGRAPCLLCAQVGHQVAACTVPEADRMATNTITLSRNDIDKIRPPTQTWTTEDDARTVFQQLGQLTVSTTGATTEAIEPTSASTPGAGTQVGDSEAGEKTDQKGGTAAELTPATKTQSVPASSIKVASDSTQGGEWKTVETKRSRGRKQGRAEATGTAQTGQHRSKPPPPPPPPPLQQQKPGAAAAPIDLVGGASETEDEDEDMEKDQSTAAPQSQQRHTGTSQNKRDDNEVRAARDHADAAALEQAIRWNNLLKIRQTLEDHTQQIQHPVEAAPPLAAIARALPNVEAKSSCAWVLESIGGRLTASPPTGNCQFYAMSEALHQRDLKTTDHQDVMLETTMLIKFAIYLAAQHETKSEEIVCNIAAILDTPKGTASDESVDEKRHRVNKYFTDLALSRSDLASTLPTALWGGLDTIRMLAKALNRPIFLLTEYSDPTDIYLSILKPQLSRQGHQTVAMHQPGATEWLKAVATELTAAPTAPIVIRYYRNHYDAVIFDRHRPEGSPLPRPRLRNTSVKELWSSMPTVDDMISSAKPRQTRETQAGGPTRADAASSEVRLTADDLYGFLAQSNWSATAKKEVISILVAGKTNFKELLTFSTEATTADAESSGVSQSPANSVAADSVYEPSEESDDDVTNPSQAYSMDSPSTSEYRAWADSMWEGVQEEWEMQHQGRLPALTDQEELTKLAVADPALGCQLGRLCENPLVFLDHFTTDGIKAWMERKRQQYCISGLTGVVEKIQDEQARDALREWLNSLRMDDDRVRIRGRLRDAGSWSLLMQHAAKDIKGAQAIPFLGKDYSRISAFVFVLEELYTDLAAHVLANGGEPGQHGGISLAEAYHRVPVFRNVMHAASREGSWAPVEKYLGTLLQNLPAAAGNRN